MHDRSRRIELPTLGVPQLAEITLALVEAAGYRLRKNGGEASATTTGGGGEAQPVAGLNLAVMEYVVRQTYDDRVIAERNAHLASDMLQRAISRKNERIERSDAVADGSSSLLILSPQVCRHLRFIPLKYCLRIPEKRHRQSRGKIGVSYRGVNERETPAVGLRRGDGHRRGAEREPARGGGGGGQHVVRRGERTAGGGEVGGPDCIGADGAPLLLQEDRAADGGAQSSRRGRP